MLRARPSLTRPRPCSNPESRFIEMERSGLPRTRQKRTSSTSAHRKMRVLAISIDGRFLDEISTIAPPGSCMHLEPASSLQEGVSKLESSPFDAVILELKPTDDDAWLALHKIGRASCRERV